MKWDDDDDDLWNGYMGAYTSEEFMEDVESTVEEAVKEEMSDLKEEMSDLKEEMSDLNKDEKEYIQERLIAYLKNNAKEWAEKKENVFKCSVEEIIRWELPLNFKIDDSLRDSDFRVLRTKYYDKVGNKISDIFDLQCYSRRLWEEESYWESVIDNNQYPHIQFKIRHLVKD